MTFTLRSSIPNKPGTPKNSALIVAGFATAFFPRLFTYFGAPAPLNFLHLAIVPGIAIVVFATTRVRHRRQIQVVWHVLTGIGIFLTCIVASAFVGDAGFINIVLQFVLFSQPFILLAAMLAIPTSFQAVNRFRYWFLSFALFNHLLAIVQSFLLPIGLYPRRNGLIEDRIAGVFAAPGGSAANYVSCTVSIFFALYFCLVFKQAPRWIRAIVLATSFYQAYISDSKQVLLCLGLGWAVLTLANSTKPKFILRYILPSVIVFFLLVWGIQNPEIEFLSVYRGWINRILTSEVYSWDGLAMNTKLATFNIVPTYMHSVWDWLFGLGPGHSVTRLGGWLIPKYYGLLSPVGITVHPASAEVFDVVWNEGWVARGSTIFFPLFTWAGIWGDFGLVGLAAYLYLGFIVWTRVCVDDYGKFMVITTAILGFILTQMEEPGHTLSLACLLALRWHEQQLANTLKANL